MADKANDSLVLVHKQDHSHVFKNFLQSEARKLILVSHHAFTDSVGILLTLCLPVSSADSLGKQFGPRSGPTNRRA